MNNLRRFSQQNRSYKYHKQQVSHMYKQSLQLQYSQHSYLQINCTQNFSNLQLQNQNTYCCWILSNLCKHCIHYICNQHKQLNQYTSMFLMIFKLLSSLHSFQKLDYKHKKSNQDTVNLNNYMNHPDFMWKVNNRHIYFH